MRIATFQGIRGGVGTTSIVAALADALHHQGEHVLLVDANPNDVLRLFFNVAQSDPQGWAGAISQRVPWHESAYRVDTGLDLLPYGRNGLVAAQHISPSQKPDAFWLGVLDTLSNACSWLIFDLPAASNEYSGLQARADLDVRVASTDAGCHVILTQAALPEKCRLLASMYDPTRILGGDILLDWRHRYQNSLIPFPMHRDEAVHEALANKTTVNLLSPESMGARDAHSLATWLRTLKGGHP